MYPHTHFLFAFFLGLVLHFFGIFSFHFAVACGVLAVLIDIDHLIEHALQCKTRPWSIKSMWNNCTHFHRYHERSFIHHRKGMLVIGGLILAILLFNLQVGLMLGIAYCSHMLLDHVRTRKKFTTRVWGWYLVETYTAFILDISLVVVIAVMLL
ncbi:MAG: hypothetical protein ACQESG_02125 [Nanobdellota archaeon]